MLQNCLDIFEKGYREHGERLILDNYELKEGSYKIILIDDEFRITDTLDVKRPKRGDSENSDNANSELIADIKFYDYHSKYLSSNKAVVSGEGKIQVELAQAGKPDGELIDRIREYILSGRAWEDVDKEKKDYLKLFFVLPGKEETEKVYQREHERYLIPNLYNSNEYNVTVGDEVFGRRGHACGLPQKYADPGRISGGGRRCRCQPVL